MSRLWCVMELFTFIVMGGNKHDVHLQLLAEEDELDEKAELIEKFTHFDAAEATCFLPEDTENLMNTIEGPFLPPSHPCILSSFLYPCRSCASPFSCHHTHGSWFMAPGS